jgi:peptidyl-tRNA hydrolase, PTH1 family
MPAIKLFVGLGNPGSEYSKTRHNAGFWFLDALARSADARMLLETKLHAEVAKVQLQGERVLLAKPNTFMNKCGQALSALCSFYKIAPNECLVAHDELDLPAGTVRLKVDGGHGGQNGLRDIIRVFGHGQFHRLRIGIGHPGHKDQVLSWVLGRPSAEQENAVIAGIDQAIAVVPQLCQGELNAAMKQLHTR